MSMQGRHGNGGGHIIYTSTNHTRTFDHDLVLGSCMTFSEPRIEPFNINHVIIIFFHTSFFATLCPSHCAIIQVPGREEDDGGIIVDMTTTAAAAAYMLSCRN